MKSLVGSSNLFELAIFLFPCLATISSYVGCYELLLVYCHAIRVLLDMRAVTAAIQ